MVDTIGTVIAASQRDDASYLSFVEGIRAYALRKVAPAMRARAEDTFRAFEQANGRPPESLDEARACLDHLPVVAGHNRIVRSAQEMKWATIPESYGQRRDELLAALDAADRRGPGSVEWDPNFPYPDYFASVEFHLQPGGYVGDPLAGFQYHYGTKILFTGDNDDDGLQRSLVGIVPLPADGVVRRALDLGCSVGQSATALKERFPDAEIWGIDLSAPMVRYAHLRAAEMGAEVHFAQRAAEATGFPDAHFDLVFSYILFHETPIAVTRQIVAEMTRIVRPGGVFAVVDMMPAALHTSPLQLYNRAEIQRHNNEPYSLDFIAAHFSGMLREAGFRHVEDRHSQVTMSWLWVAER